MKRLTLKKMLSFFLLVILSFVLVGCNDQPAEEDNTPKEINTNYTDTFKLETSYANKSFLKEGIGQVSLVQNVDGDTAHFRDSSGKTFTCRFLSINTPESTGKIDPWGKAASKFVATKLSSAKEIVLEAEKVGSPAILDNTGSRYLGYVWYRLTETDELRLLNLEVVEMCYSTYRATQDNNKYASIFSKADTKSYSTKQGVYGAKDPNFDYSGEAVEVTISEIRNNFDNYSSGTKLLITARVMRIVGDNLYLEDLDESYNETTKEYNTAGIYMFSGYGSGLGSLKIGNIVEFNCQCVNNDTYGKQLTNPRNLKVIEETSTYIIRTLTKDQISNLKNYEGFVVNVSEFKVTGKSEPNSDGAYTIYGVAYGSVKVNVRIDGSVYPKMANSSVEIGSIYNVTGGVSKYNDTYQIMLGNYKNEGKNDFLKK